MKILTTATALAVTLGMSSAANATSFTFFNYDVTALLGDFSGTLSFSLDALDTRANFPFLLGSGPYFEDFNYEDAELTIETSPVPVPAALWLMGSGLLGLLGMTGKKHRLSN